MRGHNGLRRRSGLVSRYRTLAVISRALTIASILSLIAVHAHAQPAVAGGTTFSLILKDDGTVLATGENDWGQLGNGARIDVQMPVQVVG